MSVNPDHVTLRCLIMRMWLLTGEREAGDDPNATWPAVLLSRTEGSRERIAGDGFRRKTTETVSRYVILMHNGKAVLDRAGLPKYVWVMGPEEVMDQGCHYGSYARMIATTCGFDLKGLTEWTTEEVSAMVAKAARMLGAEGNAGVKARAEEFPWFPDGWEAAVEDGLKRKENEAA